jgi:DNA-binding GntR family transcriptional regulator
MNTIISKGEQLLLKKFSEGPMYVRIVNQLIESILSGELKPKDMLPSKNELGEIFGVSRVTVRKALRSLEQ